jgi:hypothetical protein
MKDGARDGPHQNVVQTQERKKTMPGISFQKIVTDCELLNSTLKPQLTEMPHLQDESTGLETLIVEAKTLSNEQQVLSGRLREITRLRREAELRGQDLRSRIVAQLRGKLGFENENLLGYGIVPRKKVRKKAEKKKVSGATPIPQAPAPAPEAGTEAP